MSEWAPGAKAALNLAKDKVTKHVRAQTSILIDTPTSAGGNTNTNPLAKQWLSPELQDQICSIIDVSVDREGYSELLQKFNVICTVVQQVQNKVDPEKVRVLWHELMVFHKETFPWAI